MRTTFAEQPLRQRVIAVAAAYAIALSSLIVSFGAAQAAAEAANQRKAVLCHSGAAEHPAPLSDQSNGRVCIESCCVGCLVITEAVPPPALPVAVPRSLSQRIAPSRDLFWSATPNLTPTGREALH